ncbi:MAG TPA: hypothetical protein VH416_07605 [Gaiellaceae bacterium]
MAKYQILVDGQGREKLGSEDAVREWLRDYCEQHAEDDPDAAHVQLRELSAWSWLSGGKLVPRERFL